MRHYHKTYCYYLTQNIAECQAPDSVLNDSVAATWEHSPANFQTDFIELKTTLAEAYHKSMSMLQFPLFNLLKKCLQCSTLTTSDLNENRIMTEKLCY